MHGPNKRFLSGFKHAARATLFAAIALSTACTSYVAKQIVLAPQADEMMFYNPEWHRKVEKQFDLKTLRIPVGPPAAEIAVSIIPPQDYGLRFEAEFDSGHASIEMEWAPPEERPPPLNDPKGTVVVLPGAYMARYAMLAPWGVGFAAQGYRVVLVDLRGQGDSTGTYRTYGIVESDDTIQIIDALDARGLIEQPLVLMGVSFGAATALMAAPDIEGLDAIIAFEPYATAERAIVGVGTAISPWWLNWVVTDERLRDALHEASNIIGHDLAEARPVKSVASVRVPTLLIHGQADTWVPPSNSIEIYLAKPCCAQLWVVPDAEHMDLPLRYETLNRRVFHWLDVQLCQAGEDQKTVR